jgi:hypothetical protein
LGVFQASDPTTSSGAPQPGAHPSSAALPAGRIGHQGSSATAAANSGRRDAASAAVAPPQLWPQTVSFDRSMAPWF